MGKMFLKIVISGTPYQRGWEYGRPARDRIKNSIDLYNKQVL